MDQANSKSCIAFDGHRRLASGPLDDVTLAVRKATEGGAAGPIFVYDEATGRVIDLDLRDTNGETAPPAHDPETAELRGRGRPKLGVVGREVTLLPRHWEWLSTQPGGASVAIRRLVEEARRTSVDKDRKRAAQEAAYHFMSAIAGNLPGFEEAARALFACDRERFGAHIASWPEDVRDHATKLAFSGS